MRKLKQLWQDHHGFVITLVCFICVVALAVSGLDTVKGKTSEQQLTALKQAVLRAAVACYASEGFYPGQVDYLTERYGLTWDDSRYIVRYDCFAQNVLPDIRVLVRGDDAA